jgi:hypothetical protein
MFIVGLDAGVTHQFLLDMREFMEGTGLARRKVSIALSPLENLPLHFHSI